MEALKSMFRCGDCCCSGVVNANQIKSDAVDNTAQDKQQKRNARQKLKRNQGKQQKLQHDQIQQDQQDGMNVPLTYGALIKISSNRGSQDLHQVISKNLGN